MKNNGIDPEKYKQLNFESTKEDFYEKLFFERKKEKNDIILDFLISDFTTDFEANMRFVLKNDYSIIPENMNFSTVIDKDIDEDEDENVDDQMQERILGDNINLQ